MQYEAGWQVRGTMMLEAENEEKAREAFGLMDLDYLLKESSIIHEASVDFVREVKGVVGAGA